MSKHCYMCGDRLIGMADRCQPCWDIHMMIESDPKLAREVYDKHVLETLLRKKPAVFHQTLVELE